LDLLYLCTVPKMAVINKMEIKMGEKTLYGIVKEKE
jgi:hypothetical protein